VPAHAGQVERHSLGVQIGRTERVPFTTGDLALQGSLCLIRPCTDDGGVKRR